MSFHFFLPATNSLQLLTLSTWRSLSTSFFHLFLGLPLLLVLSSYWLKIFLDILTSSILSRWPNKLILCHFIHFTTFSPLFISSSSRFVRLFHSPFSYLGPYILLNIFLSKISRASSSFFFNVHAFATYDTTGTVLYQSIIQEIYRLTYQSMLTQHSSLAMSNGGRKSLIIAQLQMCVLGRRALSHVFLIR